MSNCFIRAASAVTGIPVTDLIDQIGHDGKDIIFPSCRYPYCTRGHHKQEIIDVAIRNGWMVSTIEAKPELWPFEGSDPAFIIPSSVQWHLDRFDGIIAGASEIRSHAVAWVNKEIIDNGRVIDDLDFNIIEFFGFVKIIH